jgi:hypothetical protein
MTLGRNISCLILFNLSFFELDIRAVVGGAETGLAAVILITVLGALHTAIVGVGYVLVERDRPQPWLLGVNLGACVVLGLVYLSERWGDERKRNRKEN